MARSDFYLNPLVSENEDTLFIESGTCVFSIDRDDDEWLLTHRWVPKDGYIVSTSGGNQIQLHRSIIKAPPGGHVDHIDRNPLNNKKANLRLITEEQNRWNRKFSEEAQGSSKYSGVHIRSDSGKFRAIIRHHKTKINIGTYDSEEEAARAYDRVCWALRGEFAVLNFPEEAPR